jgi:peptidoglycan/xylan/chitin deacetylase (PgdA/CDA1 family)
MTTVTASRWGRWLFVGIWVVGLALLALAAAGILPGHPTLTIVIILSLCVTIAVGVMSQRCGFFARPVLRVEGAPNLCSLTFDDGPDPQFTPRVLELLARHGHRATFFVIGERAARHPELVRRLVEEGHEVGNHTTGHPWHLALWPASRVAAELSRASDQIERAAGVRPVLFRPPAAILSPRVAAGGRAAGLTLLGFSVRAGDGSPLVSAALALRRLARGLRPGAILLLHDAARRAGAPPVSLEVLPELCAAMERAGLRSVPVSELMGPARPT